ncbi:hypothetical protein [Halopelagius fulvigenes]|uniref:Uncharacterized protein n=1 Tax=Halopelagius fulvigenes TaxID=1198324 RepID=A0ABD5U2F4_9EURY
MSQIDLLKADVEAHGEVHATVEEEDAEVEIRLGTATFHDDDEVLTLSNNQTDLRIGYDRIVSWYLPVDFYHG